MECAVNNLEDFLDQILTCQHHDDVNFITPIKIYDVMKGEEKEEEAPFVCRNNACTLVHAKLQFY